MRKIIKQILNKELCRDNDEAHAEGFWDRSNYIESLNDNLNDFSEIKQERIYSDFWEIFEEVTKQILEDQNEKLMKISQLGTYTAEDIIRENLNLIDDITN